MASLATSTATAAQRATSVAAPRTPAEFLSWLHGDLRYKTYVVQRLAPDSRQSQGLEHARDVQDGQRWRQHCLARKQLDGLLDLGVSAWEGDDDTYVMLNETRSWRTSSFVNCLKAFVVDLDCHDPGDPEIRFAVELSMRGIREAGLPQPQLVVYTGRGAQLLWRIYRVGLKKGETNAEKRWVLMQKALARAAGPQADRSLVDLVRIVRMPGTRNTKVADPSWRTWSELVPDTPDFYNFDDLCDRFLPVTREVCNVGRRRRLAKQASTDRPPRTAPAKRPGQRHSAAANDDPRTAAMVEISVKRMKDYQRIAEHFFMVGIPQGYRDQFLFCVAADMAWTTPLTQADHFEQSVIDHLMMLGSVVDQRTRSAYRGRINEPLSVGEARTAIGTVVKLFKRAAAGNRSWYAGKECDARYWLKTTTVWERLGKALETTEGLLDDLQEVLPQLRRRRTPAATSGQASRSRDTRVRSERYKRQHKPDDARAAAVAEIRAGRKQSEVAAQFGVTERTVRNWVRDREGPAARATPDGKPLSPAAPPLASAPESRGDDDRAARRPAAPAAPADAENSPVSLYGVARAGALVSREVPEIAALQSASGLPIAPLVSPLPQRETRPPAPLGLGQVSGRRVARGGRSKWRQIEESRLDRLRAMASSVALQLLADHAKQDRDFRPVKDRSSTRWHASVGGYDVELVCTGPRFWDTRAACGGAGAVDLASHLFNLDFTRALALLKSRGLDGSKDASDSGAAPE